MLIAAVAVGAQAAPIILDDVNTSRLYTLDENGVGTHLAVHTLGVGVKSNNDGWDLHAGIAFQMTGASAAELESADFSVSLTGITSTPTWNVDVYATRVASTPDFLASDFENGTKIMDDFVTTSSAVVGNNYSLDATGEANLLTYLKNNWLEGSYVFITLKTDDPDFIIGDYTTSSFYTFGGSITTWAAEGTDAQLTLNEPTNLEKVQALGNLTNAPSVYTTNGVATNVNCVGTIQSIMYDGQDYAGSPTRVWAYIGMPAGASPNSPVPAVVCVHGGGGTAFSDWVQEWNDRGYAAISMDTEGRITDPDTGVKSVHEWGGPQRIGIYGGMDQPIEDQFMYHATADTILANSLLRSLPEIDANQVGLIGVSWGGVITSTTIGIDDRFVFAIPTYGCGNMDEALNWWGNTLKNNELYKTVWDPMIRITNATLPTLWFSWPEEVNFPLTCQRDTYSGAPGPRMVSLVPGMGHGHGATWNRPESYAFADSIISNGTPWCVQQRASHSNGTVTVVFQSSKTLDSASLISTIDVGVTGDRNWFETPAALADNGGGSYTATTPLPSEYTTAWFINVGSDTLISSSDFQEISGVPAPSNVVFDVSANWSSKSVKGNDSVRVTNGATVTLDEDGAALRLTISDGGLVLDQGDGLTLSSSLTVKAGGSLLVNDGAVDLNSGAFACDGLVTLDGGTLNIDTLDFSGTGSLLLKSGGLNFVSGETLDIALIEISGGHADFGSGRIYVGENGSTEFRVVGDTASISMHVLNLQPWTVTDPTLRFVLNETGVSTIQVASFMNLPMATVIVDGSAYAGGATNFVLIDSDNLATLGDTNKFSATGFAEKGLVASVVQDQANGKDWLELVLVDTPYGSWIRGFGLSGTDLDKTANPDGDAYSNEEEYIAGLNPNVFDTFAVSNFTADVSNELGWSATSGRVYNVYWSSNLVDGFTLIQSNAPGGAFIDAGHAADPAGFYRISVELAP